MLFLLPSIVCILYISPINSKEDVNWSINPIVGSLTDQFKNSDTDFNTAKTAKSNADFIPFSKSRALNEENKRPNYEDVNNPDYGRDVTKELATWRGLGTLQNSSINRSMKLLLETSPISNFTGVMAEREIELLPSHWQYLLPVIYYKSLNMTGRLWADLSRRHPGDSGFLYKTAILLRNQDNVDKENFIESLSLPESFREVIGYILGYRWGIESGPDSEKFQFKTLSLLPSDVVMELGQEKFTNLEIPERLKDAVEWDEASPEAEVAWFTKFVELIGWKEVAGTPNHLKMHGHLMAGAPLDKLRTLVDQQTLETSLIGDVLRRTQMHPLRVQELWEALSESDLQSLYFSQSHKLDVSQLLSVYNQSFSHLDNEKTELERLWLSRTLDNYVPWTNILLAGLEHMSTKALASWGQQELMSIGKFLVILTPHQIDQIPADNFNPSVFNSVLSPMMTHCQLVSLYKKDLDYGGETLHPLLLSALPSATLLGEEDSPISAVWDDLKDDLLSASASFSPAQMAALHVVVRPGMWASSNLSSILSIHPSCLDGVLPTDLRANLDSLVNSVYFAGPQRYQDIASKLGSIPRYLLTAWLEAVMIKTEQGEMWDTDVLLDRVTDVEETREAKTDVQNHPLHHQKFIISSSNRTSYLASLSLGGLTCHCIDKVQVHDSLQVLSAYRFHIETARPLATMPSMPRKCWANKIREFLALKSTLYGVKVEGELELLSMLSTSDIKVIGPEILLTWGGFALAGIVHPEVQHEVLMAVGQSLPHNFVHTGVTPVDLEMMANNLLDQMIEDEGSVTLTALSHLHNLAPYADIRILDASAADIKLFISSVLKPMCKSVCLPSSARQRVREFILKGYGSPDTWSALHLVELGDMMIVLTNFDLMKVNPTSLRRASSYLVSNTLYTEYLTEIKEQTNEVVFHEACSSWLGGRLGEQHIEGRNFYQAWEMLAQYYILSSHLQVEVVRSNLSPDLPTPRMYTDHSESDWTQRLFDELLNSQTYQECQDGEVFKHEECFAGLTYFNCKSEGFSPDVCKEKLVDEYHQLSIVACQDSPSFQPLDCFISLTNDASHSGRKRRQAGEPINFRLLYSKVMADMKAKFDAEKLTTVQKTNATQAISDTQRMLGDHSFAVLGLDQGNLTQNEVLRTLSEYRSSGNMSNEQSLAVHELAVDTQVRMVQKLVGILDLNATYLDLSESELSSVLSRPTFTTPLDFYNQSGFNTEALELLSNQSSATVNGAEVDADLELDVETLTTLDLSNASPTTSVSTTVSTTAISVSATSTTVQSSVSTTRDSKDTFNKYEPDLPSFVNLPTKDKIVLSCDCLKAAGPAASSISPSQIQSMDSDEVVNCLSTLGKLPWTEAATKKVWTALQRKIVMFADGNMKPVKRTELLLLEKLAPAIATYNPELIDFRKENIDGISVIGRFLKGTDPVVLSLIQQYVAVNSISATNRMTSTEVASLGQLLCGLTDDQWLEQITSDVFPTVLTQFLARLDCPVSRQVKSHISSLLVNLYGPSSNWTTSDLMSVGWTVSALDDDLFSSLPADIMGGLAPEAIKYVDNRRLSLWSEDHLSNLSPHSASFIKKEQLMPFISVGRRRAISAAGGENLRLKGDLIEIEDNIMKLKEGLGSPIDIMKVKEGLGSPNDWMKGVKSLGDNKNSTTSKPVAVTNASSTVVSTRTTTKISTTTKVTSNVTATTESLVTSTKKPSFATKNYLNIMTVCIASLVLFI